MRKVILLGAALVVMQLSAYGADDEQNSTFTYDAHERRDPFMPIIMSDKGTVSEKVDAGAGFETIKFQGVAVNPEGEMVAIINGDIYKEGDTVNSIKIIKIDHQSIVVSRDGEERTMEIYEY